MATWKNAVPAASLQRDLKREVLLREAAAAFNRSGYHGTSLSDIARKLGVTKAALYTYVPSKEELLYYCHDSAMQMADDCLARAQAAGGSGLERLGETLRRYLNLMLSEEGGYVVLLEENAMKPAHMRAIVRRRDAFEKGLRELVRAGIADDSIVPCNAKLAVFAVLGALNWVCKWYVPDGEWSGPQVSAALTEMLERSLARLQSKSLTADPATIVAPDAVVAPAAHRPAGVPQLSAPARRSRATTSSG